MNERLNLKTGSLINRVRCDPRPERSEAGKIRGRKDPRPERVSPRTKMKSFRVTISIYRVEKHGTSRELGLPPLTWYRWAVLVNFRSNRIWNTKQWMSMKRIYKKPLKMPFSLKLPFYHDWWTGIKICTLIKNVSNNSFSFAVLETGIHSPPSIFILTIWGVVYTLLTDFS